MPTGLTPQDMPSAHPSRHLARTRSEEAEDPQAKKPRKNRSGVAGELAEGRKAALARIKDTLAEYGPAKVNSAKQVTKFYTTRKMDNPVGSKCVDYTNALAQLKQISKDVHTWHMKNLSEKQTNLEGEIEVLKKLARTSNTTSNTANNMISIERQLGGVLLGNSAKLGQKP